MTMSAELVRIVHTLDVWVKTFVCDTLQQIFSPQSKLYEYLLLVYQSKGNTDCDQFIAGFF
jgi:hypothetical protein